MIDGQALTLWRTAAASALAASYLAREDAQPARHGRRRRARALSDRAHASVRPIAEVLVWNRNPARAETLAAKLCRPRLFRCARRPISKRRCAPPTSSPARRSRREPLVHGAWLKPGAHLDLVGAFTPKMRESDDEAVRRARDLCRHARRRAEGGRRHRAAARGRRHRGSRHRRRPLRPLPRQGRRAGARPSEITLFKSVGTALEDLAAATLAYARREVEPPALSSPSRYARRPWRSSAATWRGSRRPPGRRRAPAPRESSPSAILRLQAVGKRAERLDHAIGHPAPCLSGVHLGERPVGLVVEDGRTTGREIGRCRRPAVQASSARRQAQKRDATDGVLHEGLPR